jgi:hypothetical protein
VLDQVGPAYAFGAHGAHHRRHALPLVESREDHRLLELRLALRVLHLLALQQHEAVEDAQPLIARQHPLPQPCHRVLAVLARRVAGRTVVAAVEGQKPSGRAVEPRRHADVAVAHRKVNHCAAAKRQQRFNAAGAIAARRAVVAVLLHRCFYRLREVGLQLHCRHRQAVDEEGQIDAIGLVQRVCELRHHAQAVGGVARDHGRVAVVLRERLAHRQRASAGHREAAAQHFDRAAVLVLQRLDQPVEHRRLSAGAVHRFELLPRLGLAVTQPASHVLGVERAGAVVCGRVADEPAGGGQLLDDVPLQLALVVNLAHAGSWASTS